MLLIVKNKGRKVTNYIALPFKLNQNQFSLCHIFFGSVSGEAICTQETEKEIDTQKQALHFTERILGLSSRPGVSDISHTSTIQVVFSMNNVAFRTARPLSLTSLVFRTFD